jgi:hypothetical protein
LRRENYGPYRDSNSNPSVVQPVAIPYTVYAVTARRWEDIIKIDVREIGYDEMD